MTADELIASLGVRDYQRRATNIFGQIVDLNAPDVPREAFDRLALMFKKAVEQRDELRAEYEFRGEYVSFEDLDECNAELAAIARGETT